MRSENKRTLVAHFLHTALLKRVAYSRVITLLELNAERHCGGFVCPLFARAVVDLDFTVSCDTIVLFIRSKLISRFQKSGKAL